MRPFKKAAIAGATAVAILFSPFMSGAVSAQAKQGYSAGIPGVNCATSGPAKSYNSATNTQRRNCWWGYEYLYSKRDSKKIVSGAAGAAAGAYYPAKIGFVVLGALITPYSAETAKQAIDDGTCLKLTFIAGMVPSPGKYSCY